MGLIVKQSELMGDKGKAIRPILFDSGARFSVIKASLAQQIATILQTPDNKPVKFYMALEAQQGESNQVTHLWVSINAYKLDGGFYLLEDLRRDIIIGADFMQKWGIKLDPRTEEIIVGVDPNALELYFTNSLRVDSREHLHSVRKSSTKGENNHHSFYDNITKLSNGVH